MRKNDKKSNKHYDYSYHGITFEKWVSTPGIELWIKVFFYIFNWYSKHPGKTFFVSNEKILKDLRACGCVCTSKGIEEAIRILKSPETTERYENGKKKKGGVGLVEAIYPRNEDGSIMSKAEWESLGNNPRKYIYRKIRINYRPMQKLISIFSGESRNFKKLANKSRYKKLVLKRPVSYTKSIVKGFKRHLKEAKVETYKNPNQMFYGFLYMYSSKWYDPTKLIKNYIPEHAINLQSQQDKEEWLNIIDKSLRGSPFYIAPEECLDKSNTQATDTVNHSVVKDFFNSII